MFTQRVSPHFLKYIGTPPSGGVPIFLFREFLPLIFEKDKEGQAHRQHVRRHLGPHDAVHAEDPVHDEKHGDIEGQPAHHRQELRAGRRRL